MDTAGNTLSLARTAPQATRPTAGKPAKRGLSLAVFAALAFAMLATLSAPTPTLAADTNLSQQTRLKHFNINRSKLAIDGYDPVSYHKSGPVKGKKDKAVRYKGVIYRFANDANKRAFLDNPSKYEPAYGGWCAWAMQEGGKTDIDPKSYLMIDGKTYLFYKGWLGDTKKDWQKRAEKQGNASQIARADREWDGITSK